MQSADRRPCRSRPQQSGGSQCRRKTWRKNVRNGTKHGRAADNPACDLCTTHQICPPPSAEMFEFREAVQSQVEFREVSHRAVVLRTQFTCPAFPDSLEPPLLRCPCGPVGRHIAAKPTRDRVVVTASTSIFVAGKGISSDKSMRRVLVAPGAPCLFLWFGQ